MVGKTNLTFISKGEASSVQLIQKSYVTGESGEIFRMEIINNNFFVFVGENHLLSGPDMDNLKLIRKDNIPLKATHIVYADDRYYIMDASDTDDNQLYMTYDFEEYEKVTIPEDLDGWENAGIFLDSKKQIVLIYITKKSSGGNGIKVCMCESLKDISIWHINEGESQNYNIKYTGCNNSFMVDDRIYIQDWHVNLSAYVNKASINFKRYMYVFGYFFKIAYENSKFCLYRSRDGMRFMRYDYELIQNGFSGADKARIIPIDNQYGLLYANSKGECYLNITDDILKIGLTENNTMSIYDDIEVTSVLTYDGKTYLGTKYGVIYEFQLDYDGMLQRPDVAVIKTLAAKQALEQAVQYTDDSIKELKNYIDEKIGEKVSAEESSTEVDV